VAERGEGDIVLICIDVAEVQQRFGSPNGIPALLANHHLV
jgi:hypothetical protein